MLRLKEYYQKEGIEILKKRLNIKNTMAVPGMKKIVINIGMGEALSNKGAIESASIQLATITGQKPVVTTAKKDVSTFKLRKGNKIGLKVTLRGNKMYDFLEKLVKIVLPRLRDFRGVSLNSFDEQGNYSLGLTEQIVFPEIDYNKIDKLRGLEMTFVVRAKSKPEAQALLSVLGMPFQKNNPADQKEEIKN